MNDVLPCCGEIDSAIESLFGLFGVQIKETPITDASYYIVRDVTLFWHPGASDMVPVAIQKEIKYGKVKLLFIHYGEPDVPFPIEDAILSELDSKFGLDNIVISTSLQHYDNIGCPFKIVPLNTVYLFSYWDKYHKIAFNHKFKVRTLDSINWESNKKKFLCTNRAREHRIIFYNLCMEHGIVDKNNFSFIYKDNKEYLNVDNFDYYEILFRTKFNKPDERVLDKSDVNFDYSLDRKYYDDSHMSIVIETKYNLFDQGIDIPFISEKTFSRIINAHPFLILGDNLINNELRYYGYEPYTNLMLIPFDRVDSSIFRMYYFFENIKMLYELPMDDFTELIRQTIPTVKHNYHHMMDKTNAERYLKSKIQELNSLLQ